MADLHVPLNEPARYFANLPNLQAEIDSFIRNGQYLGGIHLQDFEARFAGYVGSKFCAGVSSGTAALEIALTALKLDPNARVLTAANAGGYASFAIKKARCTPVYVDVNVNGLLDLAAARKILDRGGISAVIVTHLYGQVQDIGSFVEYCRKHGIRVVEDCAQAVGSTKKFAKVGSQGDISTFSFYPTKNLSSIGDGGAVCSSDSELIESIYSLREYGWSSSRYFSEVSFGGNSRMDSLHALVLGMGLDYVDTRNSKRLEIYAIYQQAISGTSLSLMVEDKDSFLAHLAVIHTQNPKKLSGYLQAKGIQSSTHYPFPDYLQPGINSNAESYKLPNTEMLCRSILSIPCFPEMTNSEIDFVASALENFSE
jgi:aminotransferase EvaB